MYKNRHQKILDAATRLFNQKGYTGVTTAEIAKEAATSEPTMYKHFKNKKELFLACFQSIVGVLFMEYRKVYKENVNDEISYLREVMEVYYDFVEQNPDKSMFLAHMLSYRDIPEFNNVFKEFIGRSIGSIRKMIESAKEKGKIKSKVDSGFLAGMFVIQYFTPIALKEFMNQKYLMGETFFQAICDMLKID